MLDWCALGSATGGKHVSAISHSRVHPVNSFMCSNRDRYSNETTCFSSAKKDSYKRSSFKSYSSSVRLRKQTALRTNFSSVPKYERIQILSLGSLASQVQRLVANTQTQSRSQANGRSNLRFSAWLLTPTSSWRSVPYVNSCQSARPWNTSTCCRCSDRL